MGSNFSPWGISSEGLTFKVLHLIWIRQFGRLRHLRSWDSLKLSIIYNIQPQECLPFQVTTGWCVNTYVMLREARMVSLAPVVHAAWNNLTGGQRNESGKNNCVCVCVLNAHKEIGNILIHSTFNKAEHQF